MALLTPSWEVVLPCVRRIGFDAPVPNACAGPEELSLPAATGAAGQRLGWLEAPAAQPWLTLAIFAFATATRLYFNWAVHPPGERLISDMWVYDLRARNLWHGTLGIWEDRKSVV